MTPRVDVDVAMSGLQESLRLGNLNKSDGKRKEREGNREERKDPGRFPVFIRSLNGRTHTLLLSPHDDVSTILCLVEDQIHVPQHLWYVRTNGRPLPDPSLPHGLSRDDVLTVHSGLAGGALPPRVPESGSAMCVDVEGAGRRGRLCRHVSVSPLDENPCRGAAQEALRSASPLLLVRARTMLLEMTRVP